MVTTSSDVENGWYYKIENWTAMPEDKEDWSAEMDFVIL